MGDCSEAGRSGGIILTPAPFCGHCSSRCGSHGPALMIPRASGGCEPLITFCLARAQVVIFCGALQPRKLCHAQERVPRRLSLAQSRLDVGLRDLPST